MKKFNFLKRRSSSEIAKNRLKILLISDRIQCSPRTLELIKGDLIKSISKYMKIDEESTEVIIKKNSKRGRGKAPALYASIPILDIRE